MEKNVINICYSSDNNFAQHLAVAIASLLVNANTNDFLKIFILDGGISEQNKAKLSTLTKLHHSELVFVNINTEEFESCHTTENYALSKAAYYRLKTPSLLPNVDKIIYIDSDTVTLASLFDLWNKDIPDYYIAGTQDFGSKEHQKRLNINTDYINSGVLVMNLAKMRADKIEEGFFEILAKEGKKLLLHDQDILNKCCSGYILPIEIKYNSPKLISPNGLIRDEKNSSTQTVILHFLNKYKPWKPIGHVYYKRIYYKYLNMTEFSTTQSKYFLWLDILTGFIFSTCADDKFFYYKLFGIKLRKKRPASVK